MSIPKLSAYAATSLARAMCHPLSLRGKALGARLKEQIILRLSSMNGCNACSAVHGVLARVKGLTADEVRGARRPEEVRALVNLFTFSNRFNNTWEELVLGAQERRSRLGLIGPRAR